MTKEFGDEDYKSIGDTEMDMNREIGSEKELDFYE